MTVVQCWYLKFATPNAITKLVETNKTTNILKTSWVSCNAYNIRQTNDEANIEWLATSVRTRAAPARQEMKSGTMVLQVDKGEGESGAQVLTRFCSVSLPPSDVLRLRSAESSRANDGPFVTTGVWKVSGLGSMLESPRPKPHSG